MVDKFLYVLTRIIFVARKTTLKWFFKKEEGRGGIGEREFVHKTDMFQTATG